MATACEMDRQYEQLREMTLRGVPLCKIVRKLRIGWSKAACMQVRLGLRIDNDIYDDSPEMQEKLEAERVLCERAQLRSEVWGELADGFTAGEIMEKHGLTKSELQALRDELMALPGMRGKPYSHWRNLY